MRLIALAAFLLLCGCDGEFRDKATYERAVSLMQANPDMQSLRVALNQPRNVPFNSVNGIPIDSASVSLQADIEELASILTPIGVYMVRYGSGVFAFTTDGFLDAEAGYLFCAHDSAEAVAEGVMRNGKLDLDPIREVEGWYDFYSD